MEYHVALSFAGEDREYVDQVAGFLRRSGVVVFYDKYEQVDLWGKDLYEHLSDVYQNKARYTVMFVSKMYAEKLWARHERKNAQARAFREHREYILPARFDDTEVPGLPDTVGYLDLRSMQPSDLAKAICEKLVASGVPLSPKPLPPSGIPQAPAAPSSVRVSVRTESGEPLSSADILLVASNGTHQGGRTGDDGAVVLDVAKRRTYTVFCACYGRPAYLGPEFDPVRDLAITLPNVPGVGSLVCIGGHNAIPGLKGSMNPIHDAFNRLYVYTSNIAVDAGKGQPVSFELGRELHFEDSDGNERFVTFVGVIGDCFLLEHRMTNPSKSGAA